MPSTKSTTTPDRKGWLLASTKMVTGPKLSTASSSPAAASRPIWYFRPAQPPSVTAIRKPAAPPPDFARTRSRVETAASVRVTMSRLLKPRCRGCRPI